MVTRPQQNNNTQLWRIIQFVVGGTQQVTIQQVSSGRFLEAYTTDARDFQVVTRPERNTSLQVWQIHDADRFDPNEPKSSGSALAGRRYLVDSMRNVEAC